MESECITSLKNQITKKRGQKFIQYIANYETKEEFLNRQKEYDKLYKYSYSIEQIPKHLKKQNHSNLVNKIKQQIIEKSEIQRNYFIFKDNQLEQQQRSIEMIAEFLRNQKKAISDKQISFEQKQKQYNLIMILVIALPILCILTVMTQI